MNKVIKIIELLENTSSTNDKIKIIKENSDNELFKKVLYYTYNQDLQYGFSEEKLRKGLEDNIDIIIKTLIQKWNNPFEMLDELSKSNINDNLRLFVYYYLNNTWSDYKELLIRILTKDLRIGCNIKNINKAIPNLIPTFGVMLAESYFKQKENYINGREFIITQKLDGNRLIIIKESDEIKFYTRQGKEMTGLIEIEKDMKELPNGFAYDGELISENPNNLPSDELFTITMKEARKKGIKKGLVFNCFDIIPLEDFNKGICKIPCIERKSNLNSILKNKKLNYITEVPILYKGTDEGEIIKWIRWAKENEMEGIMINLSESPYECKRSKYILKGKVFQDVDLKVVDYQEGKGNLKNTLGALIVEYKNNTVAVGSGYTLEERNNIWNNKNNIIGKIITVQYFEEIKDKKTGLYSLRFPVFKQLRNDKTEPSYN